MARILTASCIDIAEIVSVTPSGFVNIHHRVYMNSYDTSEQPLHKRVRLFATFFLSFFLFHFLLLC